jgi:hypothetical protein
VFLDHLRRQYFCGQETRRIVIGLAAELPTVTALTIFDRRSVITV